MVNWRKLEAGNVLSYAVDEFDGNTREICMVMLAFDDMVVCETMHTPGGTYKLCIDDSNAKSFKKALSIEEYCKYMGFPKAYNIPDLLRMAEDRNIWSYCYEDRYEMSDNDTILVYDKDSEDFRYFETGATPVGLQPADNVYYQVNDGFFSYFVNTVTGEKKFELDKGELLTEREIDDFSREEV